jgi:hypothetical protein
MIYKTILNLFRGQRGKVRVKHIMRYNANVNINRLHTLTIVQYIYNGVYHPLKSIQLFQKT